MNVSQLKAVDAGLRNIDSWVSALRHGDKGLVTLEGAAGTVITNLADGAVSALSSDAVNGSQLFDLSQSVANHLGGGATVNVDGTVNGADL